MKKFLDTVYICGNVVGSGLIALNIGYNFFGYLLFFISSIIGIKFLAKSNANKSLLYVAVYFAVVNLVGIFRA